MLSAVEKTLYALLEKLDRMVDTEVRYRKGWEASQPSGGPSKVPQDVAEASMREGIYAGLAVWVRDRWVTEAHQPEITQARDAVVAAAKRWALLVGSATIPRRDIMQAELALMDAVNAVEVGARRGMQKMGGRGL